MTLVESRPTVPETFTVLLPASAPAAKRRSVEGFVVFGACAAFYVALGALLALRYDSILEDALSRVANGSFMITSRDPKFSSVGFVWMPLPSLLDAPFVLLGRVWPSLTARGLVANIESALFMAGAVAMLRSMLVDLRVGRAVRLVLLAVFALDPMIVFFGANGMTEAAMLLFLLAAARPLARWLTDPKPRTRDVVFAGLALGIGDLCRYEVFAAGLVVTALVVVTSFRRSPPARARGNAASDGLLVGLPVVIVTVGWAVTSWLIVGHPFDTFTSRYGNSAAVNAHRSTITAATGGSGLAGVEYVARQLLALAPWLIPVLLGAAYLAWRRRDLWVLAPIAVLAPVFAFQSLALVAGTSWGWLRFQIGVVPLVVLLVGYLLAPARGARSHGGQGGPPLRGLLAAPLALVIAGGGLVTTALMFRDGRLAYQEHQYLLPVVDRVLGDAHAGRGELGQFVSDRRVAAYLDAQRLPRGSVLVDAAPGYAVVLASAHPSRFVITPDQDFDRVVSDPVAAGVRYVLTIRDPGGLDAVATHFPHLYETGGGFSRFVREFRPPRGVQGHTWRVFRVRAVPGSEGATTRTAVG